MSACTQITVQSSDTYPSRTALPKGRVLLEPPRNRFQMVSPKEAACAAEEKPAAPVAPPRERVTILPLDWHVLMSLARNAQLGRFVPGKTPESTALQTWETVRDVSACFV